MCSASAKDPETGVCNEWERRVEWLLDTQRGRQIIQEKLRERIDEVENAVLRSLAHRAIIDFGLGKWPPSIEQLVNDIAADTAEDDDLFDTV